MHMCTRYSNNTRHNNNAGQDAYVHSCSAPGLKSEVQMRAMDFHFSTTKPTVYVVGIECLKHRISCPPKRCTLNFEIRNTKFRISNFGRLFTPRGVKYEIRMFHISEFRISPPVESHHECSPPPAWRLVIDRLLGVLVNSHRRAAGRDTS